MDTLYVAKALVSLVAVATVIGAVLADLVIPATARQHMRNPNWPPHAKFHNGQTISLGVLLGILALFLVWYPGGNQRLQFQVGVVVAALYWLSMLSAGILPGTRWVDPEFEEPNRPAPRIAAQLRLGLVLLAILLVGDIIGFL